MTKMIKLVLGQGGFLFLWIALFLAGAVSILRLPVLPFTDLPNHLLEGYVLKGCLPAYEAKIAVYTPSCLHAVFCALFPDVEVGNKFFFGLYLLLLPLSLLLLIRASRGDKWLALLAFCFLFNYSATWGFVNFTMGIPLAFLALHAYTGILTEPSPRRCVIMTFLLALVFYAHCLVYLFVVGVLGAGALLLRQVPWKHRIAALWPALLPLILCFFWLLNAEAWHTQDSTFAFLARYYAGEYLPSLRLRLADLLVGDNTALFKGAAGRLTALLWSVPVIALLPFVLKRVADGFCRCPAVRETARPGSLHRVNAPDAQERSASNARSVALVVLLVAAGCFLLLPDRLPAQQYLYERFSVFVFLALIWTGSFVLPPRCRIPARLLAVCLAIASAGLWGHYFRQFGKEADAFQRVLRASPELRGRSLAAIIAEPDYRGRPVYFHYQNYQALYNDGLAPSQAAHYRFSLIAFRPDGVMPVYCRHVLNNSDVNVLSNLYGLVDFLLVRGSNAVAVVLRDDEFIPFARQDKWVLFRLALRRPQYEYAAADKLHHLTGRHKKRSGLQELVLAARQDRDAPGWLAFGYQFLVAPGRCVFEFDLSITNAGADQAAATVDVVRNRGREILDRREITATAAPPITLEIEARDIAILEPRVLFHGRGDATLRGISMRVFPPTAR